MTGEMKTADGGKSKIRRSETRTWTAAQSDALAWNGNLLISAVAGSGKTATLTERIIRLIVDEDVSPSRIAVVTFSRAAAAELYSRISDALSAVIAENPGVRRLSSKLAELESAKISTIHAFCMSLIRPNFSLLGLPPTFRIGDEGQIGTLRSAAMNTVLDDFFDGELTVDTSDGAVSFEALASAFGGSRDEKRFDEEMLAIADFLESNGFGADRLTEYADELCRTAGTGFFASVYGDALKRRVIGMAEYYSKIFAVSAKVFTDDATFARYLPLAVHYTDFCDTLAGMAKGGTYDSVREQLGGFTDERMPIVSTADQTDESLYFKEMRNAFKTEIKSTLSAYFKLTEAEIAVAMTQTASYLRTAATVEREFGRLFSDKKRQLGILDYGDLEMLAYRLLVNPDGSPTDAARDVSEQFDYIFIDEYQDTNRVQDKIFENAALHAPRFLVGDVKQSIYSFRGAQPEVFNSYRDKWNGTVSDGGTAASVYMSENFRCSEKIIRFINMVSRRSFPAGDTPFTKKDELVCALPDTPSVPVEIRLIDAAQLKTDMDGHTVQSKDELEADMVARRITELVKTETRADGSPITYADIAVLLRSAKNFAEVYTDVFRRYGIPVRSQAAGTIFDTPEVMLAVSIILALDNPANSRDLAAAMKSPVFGFTADDLVLLGAFRHDRMSLWSALIEYSDTAEGLERNSPEYSLVLRCGEFVTRFAALRERLCDIGCDEACDFILRDMRLIAICDAAPDSGTSPTENLLQLYDMARTFEHECGGGLYGFAERLRTAMSDGVKDSDKRFTGSGVSIMSIHASKGLEFPVCFICRTQSEINLKDTQKNILTSASLGVAMKIPDSTGFVKCDTPLRQAVCELMRRAKSSEEMRLLHVAMTRARERLIITAAVEKPRDCFAKYVRNAEFVTPYFVMQKIHYLDWILMAAADNLSSDAYSLCIDDEVTDEAAASAEMADIAEKRAIPPDVLDDMRRRIAFEYPFAYLRDVPAKLTVTKLSPVLLDDGADGGEGSVSLTDTGMTDAATLPDTDETGDAPAPAALVPHFISGETEVHSAAEAGSATHVFMQFCDFESLDKSVTEEAARLVSLGFMTEECARLVRLDEIERFAKSPLYKKIVTARRLWREFRFNIAMPAYRFTSDKSLAEHLEADGVSLTVQGVIDCMIEDADGRVILIDYKTDRLSEYEMTHRAAAEKKLLDRHSLQLGYYREACSAMLGRTLDEVCIYSLALGDTVTVPDGCTAAEVF